MTPEYLSQYMQPISIEDSRTRIVAEYEGSIPELPREGDILSFSGEYIISVKPSSDGVCGDKEEISYAGHTYCPKRDVPVFDSTGEALCPSNTKHPGASVSSSDNYEEVCGTEDTSSVKEPPYSSNHNVDPSPITPLGIVGGVVLIGVSWYFSTRRKK